MSEDRLGYDKFYENLFNAIMDQVAKEGIAMVAVNGIPVGMFKNEEEIQEDEELLEEGDIIKFPTTDSPTKH